MIIPIKKNSNRIEVLDGIRGIAILLVVLFHYINNPLWFNYSNNIIIKILKNTTYFGWVGVDLFFVLSGFLIGGILLRNRQSTKYFSTFYTRRVLRIIPVYFLLLILFYILQFSIGDEHYYIFRKPLPAWSYFTFTQNIFMGLRGHFGSEGLTPTWSLAIEEQFYLLCPLLIWLVNPRYLIYVLIGAICAAPVFRYFSSNWYQSYTWFTSRMDSLSFGVLCVYLYNKDSFKEFVTKYKAGIAIFVSLLGFLIFLLEVLFGSLGVLKHDIFALFFSGLIIISLSQPESLFAKALRFKWLNLLGLISYSLYLFHDLFNGLFQQIFLKHLNPVLNNLNDVLVSIFALAASLLFSSILYLFVESPAIKFGKTFTY